jgi:hypothetical protein
MRSASSGPASRHTPHAKPSSPFSEVPATRKPRANTADGVGYKPIAPSVEIDPMTGCFKRRPAHIRALEESKKSATNAQRAREQAALVDQARDSCIELRTTLSATAARLDFTMIDRIVAARGDAALAPLRQQLDALVQLALAFVKVCGGSLAALESRLNGRPANGNATNALRIKTVVVALRALTDKLSTDIEAAAAVHVDALVEQGLLEQIFSWASEAESTYEILD